MSPITARWSPSASRQSGRALAVDVQHLLAGAAEGHRLVLRHDEAVAGLGRQHALARRACGRRRARMPTLSSRSSISRSGSPWPARRRQLVAGQGEEAAVGGEDQQLVGGLGRDQEGQLVALLELQLRGVLDPALGGADPAALGQDDGDRLARDHGLDGGRGVDRRAPRRRSSGACRRAVSGPSTLRTSRRPAPTSFHCCLSEASMPWMPSRSSASSACSRRSSISSSRASWRRRVLRMASAWMSVEVEGRRSAWPWARPRSGRCGSPRRG